MDTRSFNGQELFKARTGEYCPEFKNGDHTTTLISTERGKVIEIHHNVMTPQPYNRMYQLTGTKGFVNKYPVEGFALATEVMKKAGVNVSKDYTGHSYLSKEDTEALLQRFTSPLVKRYGEEFAPNDAEKQALVSVGIFTIVQLERNVQMLIPAYDFCIPHKECVSSSEDPCELFSSIDFPTSEFFPSNTPASN